MEDKDIGNNSVVFIERNENNKLTCVNQYLIFLKDINMPCE